jgi:hypothetical protein
MAERPETKKDTAPKPKRSWEEIGLRGLTGTGLVGTLVLGWGLHRIDEPDHSFEPAVPADAPSFMSATTEPTESPMPRLVVGEGGARLTPPGEGPIDLPPGAEVYGRCINVFGDVVVIDVNPEQGLEGIEQGAVSLADLAPQDPGGSWPPSC